MKARDVMVSPVITVKPRSSVKELVTTLMDHRISAVPVLDDDDRLVGIVCEGDLHRVDAGFERPQSSWQPWWLRTLMDDETFTTGYVKVHGGYVSDIMSREVITAGPDTPLHEILTLLWRNEIKRVPIVENGRVIGIVSRANLIQAAANGRRELEMPIAHSAIRSTRLEAVRD
jgi:CBS domain-containing protein